MEKKTFGDVDEAGGVSDERFRRTLHRGGVLPAAAQPPAAAMGSASDEKKKACRHAAAGRRRRRPAQVAWATKSFGALFDAEAFCRLRRSRLGPP